ncbi:hypothetical protein WN51_02128 [Melipona quadrifasciata]|uniref:Uncharacterized protein n=1 Tax=Melipona quadrifasciata TaxID=166423 RepID=A0A0N0BDN4_9HYME|nr:hypothetical protein WN51_02128 [Melipona quadrifasciata]
MARDIFCKERVELMRRKNERHDIATLLLGTLKTYQRAACDEESMTLKCPVGTTISVVLAQYGRAASNGTDRCSSSDPSVYIGDRLTNLTCIWPQSLQTHSETVCSLEDVSFFSICISIGYYFSLARQHRRSQTGKRKISVVSQLQGLICSLVYVTEISKTEQNARGDRPSAALLGMSDCVRTHPTGEMMCCSKKCHRIPRNRAINANKNRKVEDTSSCPVRDTEASPVLNDSSRQHCLNG